MMIFKGILYVMILTPFFSFAQEKSDSTKNRKFLSLSMGKIIDYVKYSDRTTVDHILSKGFSEKKAPFYGRRNYLGLNWTIERRFKFEILLSNYLSVGYNSYFIESELLGDFSLPENYLFYDNQQTLYVAGLYLKIGYNEIKSNGVFIAYTFHNLTDLINIKIETGVDFITISRSMISNVLLEKEDYYLFDGDTYFLNNHKDNFEEKISVDKMGFSTGLYVEAPAQSFVFITAGLSYNFMSRHHIDAIYQGEPYEIPGFSVSGNYRTYSFGIGLRL